MTNSNQNRNSNRGQNNSNSSRPQNPQPPGQFTFFVNDLEKRGLVNAKISLTIGTQPAIERTTGPDGKGIFTGLQSGTRYDCEISLEGYKNFNSKITPTNKNNQLLVTLSPRVHRLDFYAQDAVNKQELSGAIIKVFRATGSGRKLVDTATTCHNMTSSRFGAIMSLPNGEYVVVVEMEGYSTVTTMVDIDDSASGDEFLIEMPKKLTTPKKVILFHVIDSAGKPIENNPIKIFPDSISGIIEDGYYSQELEFRQYRLVVKGYKTLSVGGATGDVITVAVGTPEDVEVKVEKLDKKTVPPTKVMIFTFKDHQRKVVNSGSFKLLPTGSTTEIKKELENGSGGCKQVELELREYEMVFPDHEVLSIGRNTGNIINIQTTTLDRQEVIVKKIGAVEAVPLAITFTGETIETGVLSLAFAGSGVCLNHPIKNNLATPKLEVKEYIVAVDGYEVAAVNGIIEQKLNVVSGMSQDVTVVVSKKVLVAPPVKTIPLVTFHFKDEATKSPLPGPLNVKVLHENGTDYSNPTLNGGLITVNDVEQGKVTILVEEGNGYEGFSGDELINDEQNSFDIELKKKEGLVQKEVDVQIKVVDEETKEPVVGALVEIMVGGASDSDRTNSLGVANLRDIPIDKIGTVQITKTGYFPSGSDLLAFTLTATQQTKEIPRIKTWSIRFYGMDGEKRVPVKVIPARNAPLPDDLVDTKVSYRYNGDPDWTEVDPANFCAIGGNDILLKLDKKGTWTIRVDQCRGYRTGQEVPITVPAKEDSARFILEELPSANIQMILCYKDPETKAMEELTNEEIDEAGGFEVVDVYDSTNKSLNPRVGIVPVATYGNCRHNRLMVKVDLQEPKEDKNVPVCHIDFVPPRGHKRVQPVGINMPFLRDQCRLTSNKAFSIKIAVEKSGRSIKWQNIGITLFLMLSVVVAGMLIYAKWSHRHDEPLPAIALHSLGESVEEMPIRMTRSFIRTTIKTKDYTCFGIKGEDNQKTMNIGYQSNVLGYIYSPEPNAKPEVFKDQGVKKVFCFWESEATELIISVNVTGTAYFKKLSQDEFDKIKL